MLKRLPILIFLVLSYLQNNAQLKEITKYSLKGKAVHNNLAQGYMLEVVDDGTGKVTGYNISIVENGRQIIGEVVGEINYSKKKIHFKELRVTNLRKGETQNDYCFFEIFADYYIKDGRTVIAGRFEGHLPNGQSCGGGDIYLLGPKSVEAIHLEYLKKEEAKKLAAIPKKIIPKKIVPKKIIDTPKIIIPKIDTIKPVEKIVVPALEPNQSHFDYSSNNLKIYISDYDKEDGDEINLYLNNKLILKDDTLQTSPKLIELNMQQMGNGTGIDTLIVLALNEGYYNLNSAKIVVEDTNQQFIFYASNTYLQRKYLILRKKK